MNCFYFYWWLASSIVLVLYFVIALQFMGCLLRFLLNQSDQMNFKKPCYHGYTKRPSSAGKKQTVQSVQ